MLHANGFLVGVSGVQVAAGDEEAALHHATTPSDESWKVQERIFAPRGKEQRKTDAKRNEEGWIASVNATITQTG